jgi:hypothetical protein
VGADGHHAAARGAFFVQLVELQLDLLKELARRIVAAFDQQDVVVAQRVRHHHEVLAVDLLDERLVAAQVIDVIGVAQLLQQRQRVRAAAQPVGVVAGGRWPVTSSTMRVPSIRNWRSSARLIAYCELQRGPWPPPRGRAHDLARQLRMAARRFADHVRRHLDAMLVPQIQQARDAFAVAVGEPGVGGAGRPARWPENRLSGTGCPFPWRLAAGFELHGNRNHQPRVARPEAGGRRRCRSRLCSSRKRQQPGGGSVPAWPRN